jgi:hypothetical protein
MLLATVNEAVTLSILASDGRTDLFGQARVYNASGSLVSTVNLNHVAEGLYSINYTPTTEGYFNVIYQLYFDAGRTVDAGYDHQGETLDVNSFRTNILRVLGLLHENAVVDQQTYDGDGNLLTARIRSYNNSTNASNASAVSPAAYNTGLLFTWQVDAAWASGEAVKYTIVRVP